jgi:hypothetical protein
MKNYLLVYTKRILTLLGLRNRQSCKYCGRNQWIIFSVKDYVWEEVVPEKYRYKCLCLECFARLAKHDLFKIEIMGFEKG